MMKGTFRLAKRMLIAALAALGFTSCSLVNPPSLYGGPPPDDFHEAPAPNDSTTETAG